MVPVRFVFRTGETLRPKWNGFAVQLFGGAWSTIFCVMSSTMRDLEKRMKN